jgi:hypothetical protein
MDERTRRRRLAADYDIARTTTTKNKEIFTFQSFSPNKFHLTHPTPVQFTAHMFDISSEQNERNDMDSYHLYEGARERPSETLEI